MHFLIDSPQLSYESGTVIMPTLQVEKLRLRTGLA